MITLRLVLREMLSQSRGPSTWYLRVGAALVSFMVVLALLLEAQGASGAGGEIVRRLYPVLLLGVWVIMPLTTADTLSRETREGTLPLLFLTPLKPRQVVIAKLAAHAFRGLSVLGSIIPVLAFPLLLGGVNWQDVALHAAVLLGSLWLALCSGVLASAFCVQRTRAVATAAFVALCAAVVGLLCCAFALRGVAQIASVRGYGGVPISFWVEATMELVVTGAPGVGAGGWLSVIPSAFLGVVAGVVTLQGACMVEMAARKVAKGMRHVPPPRWQTYLESLLFVPRFGTSYLGALLRGLLDRNPVGWLEARTWSSRLTLWCWLAIATVVFLAGLTDPSTLGTAFVAPLMVGLSISMAISSAGSFRRERENGALELILVSPIRESELIRGRLLAILLNHAPAFLLILGCWGFLWFEGLTRSSTRSEFSPGTVMLYLINFLTVPTVGLHYSLKRTSFMSALLSSFWTAALAPWLAVLASALLARAVLSHWGVYWPAAGGFRFLASAEVPWVVFSIAQLAGGAWCWSRLRNSLRSREFVTV